MFRLANETKVDHLFDLAVRVAGGALHLGGAHQPAVLARNAHRPATGAGDPADDILVDRARQHHLGHFGRGLVGDAQPVDEVALHPQLLEHGADLRAAAVDHDRVDANGLQQHHIFGKVVLQFGVAHRVAAVFHHERASGVALQVGQCLDEGFGLGEHCRIMSHKAAP